MRRFHSEATVNGDPLIGFFSDSLSAVLPYLLRRMI